MVTAFALMNHMFQVHKESLKVVPNAREGRDSVELAIHGMQGVPDDAKREKESQNEKASKRSRTGDSDDESGDGEESEADEKEEAEEAPAATPAPEEAAPAIPAAPVPVALQPPNPFSPGTGYTGPMMNPMAMGRGFIPPQMAGRGMPMPTAFGMPGSFMNMPQPPAPPAQPQAPQPPTAPAVTVPFASVVEEDKKGGKTVFVFKNELSMEELRAQLPKHRVDPEQSSANRLSSLSESIQQRMNDLKRQQAMRG